MSDLLSELLPEMAGEVRRWLSTIDRVRLQRVSRQFHARDPGPLLSRVWQEIARPCVTRSVGALIFALVAAGVHELDAPSEVRQTNDISLCLQWYRLPVACMIEGAAITNAVVYNVEVKEKGEGKLAMTSYCTTYTDTLGWSSNARPASFPMVPGFVTVYGDMSRLGLEVTYRAEHRDNTVAFQQMTWVAAKPIFHNWKIPLKEI